MNFDSLQVFLIQQCLVNININIPYILHVFIISLYFSRHIAIVLVYARYFIAVASGYASSRFRENHEGMELNGR